MGKYQPVFLNEVVIGQFLPDGRYESWIGSWFSLDALNWGPCLPFKGEFRFPSARLVMKYGDVYRMIPA